MWEPVWLGQLEGRGTEECSEGRGGGGQTLLIAQLGLGWTLMEHRGRKPSPCQGTGRAHYLGCRVSHPPQAVFNVRNE